MCTCFLTVDIFYIGTLNAKNIAKYQLQTHYKQISTSQEVS